MAQAVVQEDLLTVPLSTAQKARLAAAAAAQGAGLSEFVLEAALRAAAEPVDEDAEDPGPFLIRLAAEESAEFLASLDAPPPHLPELAAAFARHGFTER